MLLLLLAWLQGGCIGLTTFFFWLSDSSLSKSGSSMTNESIWVAIGPSGSLSVSSCLLLLPPPPPFGLEAEALLREGAWGGRAVASTTEAVAAASAGRVVLLHCWTSSEEQKLVEAFAFGVFFMGFLEDLGGEDEGESQLQTSFPAWFSAVSTLKSRLCISGVQEENTMCLLVPDYFRFWILKSKFLVLETVKDMPENQSRKGCKPPGASSLWLSTPVSPLTGVYLTHTHRPEDSPTSPRMGRPLPPVTRAQLRPQAKPKLFLMGSI